MPDHSDLTARRMAVFEAPLDADGVQASSGLDEFGREVPDPVPVAAPAGFHKSESLGDMIKRMVNNQLMAAAAEAEGFETMEEADDFDVEDDPLDPHTPYEAVFDPLPEVPGKAAQAAPGKPGEDAAAGPKPTSEAPKPAEPPKPADDKTPKPA